MKNKLKERNRKVKIKSLAEEPESLNIPEEEREPEELMHTEVMRECFHEGEEDDENVIERVRLF